jgi:hypothetical protein
MLTFVLGFISWRDALIGTLLFLVTFAISLGIVAFIMVKIPHNYFREDYSPEFLSGHHPVIRVIGFVGKNVLGVLLVILGIVMSIPGVPGQGILTILLGVMLLDFPGRRSLELKLVSRPRVFKTINKLRHRYGKPALVVD